MGSVLVCSHHFAVTLDSDPRPQPLLLRGQAMLRAGTSQKEIDRYRRARAGEARQQIGAFLTRADLPLARMTLRIVQGDAGQALVRLTRSGRTDLVALGTHGGNALSQALPGSVARYVLRAAGCDVLVSA